MSMSVLQFYLWTLKFQFPIISCVLRSLLSFKKTALENVKLTLRSWAIEKQFMDQIGPKQCSSLSERQSYIGENWGVVGKLSGVFH